MGRRPPEFGDIDETPSAHTTTHTIGGTDPIQPGTVDAARAYLQDGTTPNNRRETGPRHIYTNFSVTPQAGVCVCHRLPLVAGWPYATLYFVKGTTAGATIANAFAALFDIESNARLALTGDLSSAIGAAASGALITATLSYTPTTSKDYWLGFLIGSAGTMPTIQGPTTAASQIAIVNRAPAVQTNHTTTGLTAMPATFTPGLPSAIRLYFFGIE